MIRDIMYLIWYDVIKSIYQESRRGKNDDPSVSLGEPITTPENKCYVVVTQVGNHYKVTISDTIDDSAVRCQECSSRRQAEHLAELAQKMYKSSDF